MLALPPSRIQRFSRCGAHAYVLRSTQNPDKYRISCDRCRDRFCIPCAKERSRVVASNVRAFIEERSVRFITLTLRSVEGDLAGCVDRLYACFSRLKRRKLWSNSQVGGVAFLEIKWSPAREQWHPHLHIISEGRFLDQRHLSRAWRQVTGDSYVVDIRVIKSSEAAARYVTKYASKGLSGAFSVIPSLLRQAIQCLSGRRLFATYGSWKGADLSKFEMTEDWTPVASLNEMLFRCRMGDLSAREILESLGLVKFPFQESEP